MDDQETDNDSNHVRVHTAKRSYIQKQCSDLKETDCETSCKLRCVRTSTDGSQPSDASLQETPQPTVHISDLPITVLIRTFSYLSRRDLLLSACTVCKYWKSVALDADLWRIIKLQNNASVKDTILLKLMRLSKNVTYLDISGSRSITNNGLIEALRCGESITTLKLMRCYQLDSSAFSMIGKCCKLRTLDLDSCNQVQNKDLTQIANGCMNLQELGLNSCFKLSDDGLQSIGSKCSNLIKINMNHCHSVTDDSLQSLATGCPRLQSILLMSCSVTNDGIKHLCQLSALKILDLSHISAITPQSINSVVKSCQKLESLNLSLCQHIDDNCVKYIAQTAKCLRSLYLVSCAITDEALYQISKYCKRIETLDVGWCSNITGAGATIVSDKCINTLTYFGLMRCDQVEHMLMKILVEKYPTIYYSTMQLDCKRLVEKARKEGHLI